MDVFRIVAAFGVISLHVKSSTFSASLYHVFFWPLCVPFFYVASLTFFTASLQKNLSIKLQFSRTLKRLILPYFVWTILYEILFFLRSLFTNAPHKFIFWRVLFYGESAVHLYFVPTLIFFQIITLSIILLTKPETNRRLLGIFLLIFASVYFLIGEFYDCFGVATVGQIFGIVLYLSCAFLASEITKKYLNIPLLVRIGLILVTCAIVGNYFNKPWIILGYPMILPVGGIGLFLISLGLPHISVPSWIVKLSSTSFGIYLCHVVFLEGFELVLEKYFKIQFYDFWVKSALVSIIFLSSLAFVFVVRRNFYMRKLLLGEM